jgi:hypothetical protein
MIISSAFRIITAPQSAAIIRILCDKALVDISVSNARVNVTVSSVREDRQDDTRE